MIAFFKSLFCSHVFEFHRNIYGDEINFVNARSVWKCMHCDKISYRPELYKEESK